jgi:hypothetical protein
MLSSLFLLSSSLLLVMVIVYNNNNNNNFYITKVLVHRPECGSFPCHYNNTRKWHNI